MRTLTDHFPKEWFGCMRKNDAVIFRHTPGGENWHKDYLLISDIHIDSKDCDRDLLKRLLDEAKAKDATVLIFGDLFDMMGGKYDPRTNKGHVASAYQVAEYFDAVVDDAYNFLSPYSGNIGMISLGNHEYSVIKRHETNPIKNLIYRLGEHIEYGEYDGFIRFYFEIMKHSTSRTMYYTHGTGGNSPVTKGVIQTNRRAANIDADFFVSGHIHQGWNVPHARIRLNEQCIANTYDQEHIQLGTFKNSGAWERSKGFTAPVKGGYWLTFSGVKHTKHEIRRAK